MITLKIVFFLPISEYFVCIWFTGRTLRSATASVWFMILALLPLTSTNEPVDDIPPSSLQIDVFVSSVLLYLRWCLSCSFCCCNSKELIERDGSDLKSRIVKSAGTFLDLERLERVLSGDCFPDVPELVVLKLIESASDVVSLRCPDSSDLPCLGDGVGIVMTRGVGTGWLPLFAFKWICPLGGSISPLKWRSVCDVTEVASDTAELKLFDEGLGERSLNLTAFIMSSCVSEMCLVSVEILCESFDWRTLSAMEDEDDEDIEEEACLRDKEESTDVISRPSGCSRSPTVSSWLSCSPSQFLGELLNKSH